MLNLAHLCNHRLFIFVFFFSFYRPASANSDVAVFRFMGQVYFKSDIDRKVNSLRVLRCFHDKVRLNEYLNLSVPLGALSQVSPLEKRNFAIKHAKLIYHMTNNAPSGHESFAFRGTKKCPLSDVASMSKQEKAVLSTELYLRSLSDTISLKLISAEFDKNYPHYLLGIRKTKELWR